MISEPLYLTALIVALTALGFWLEQRFSFLARVGASLLVILLGALVSNLGLVPLQSPVYDQVYGPITSLAIVWLLLAVDWRDLRAAGPTMLGIFAVAVVATCLGALCAHTLIDVGEEGWKLAGALTGSYSGGSLNLAAVNQELQISPSTFTAVVAADNAITALWFGITILLPPWLFRVMPRRKTSLPEEPGAAPHPMAEVTFKVVDICVLSALGLAIMAAAELVGIGYRRAGLDEIVPIPGVLWLTTIALACGLLPAVRRLHGAFPLGVIALHIFFVVIGIGARIAEVLGQGLAVLAFTATIVAVHGLVLFLFAWARRLDWDLAAVASQAAIGGPSTAMALAVTRKRTNLALPGIAVGLLGYAVGTYAGFAVAALVR